MQRLLKSALALRECAQLLIVRWRNNPKVEQCDILPERGRGFNQDQKSKLNDFQQTINGSENGNILEIFRIAPLVPSCCHAPCSSNFSQTDWKKFGQKEKKENLLLKLPEEGG